MVCILNTPGVSKKHEGTQKYSQGEGGGTEINNIKDTPELGSSPLGSPPQTQWRSWSEHRLFSSRNAAVHCFCHLLGCGSSAVPILRGMCVGGYEPSALSAHLPRAAVQPQEAAALENWSMAGKQSLWQHYCSLLLSFPRVNKFPGTSGGLDLMYSLALEHRNQSSAPAPEALQSPSALTQMCVIFHVEAFWNSECNTRIPPTVTVIMWLKLVLITLIFGAAALAWTFRTKNSETSVSW